MHRTSTSIRLIALLALLSIVDAGGRWAAADPTPGDVYREFNYVAPGGQIPIYDPGIEGLKPTDFRQPIDMKLDLKGATRAEITFEFWGGHIGTSGEMFLINGANWTPIPQPVGTPTPPIYYYRDVLGTPAVPIPLGNLKDGDNAIRLTAGPQTAYNFNLGFYHLNSFRIRVYYGKSYPHPVAAISSPSAGHKIGDWPKLSVAVARGSMPVTRVDYFGRYDDFNWSGDGRFREWHHQDRLGVLGHTLGESTDPTHGFAAYWDTTWVPDQTQPMDIYARLQGKNGVFAITPIVLNLRLARPVSVRMYKADHIPECFGSHWWYGPKQCGFHISDDLSHADKARFVMSDWSFSHAAVIRFNNRKLADSLGIEHEYSLEQVNLPVSWLRRGLNTFYWNNPVKNHPAEVNWPGPVVIVRYKTRLATQPNE